MFIPYSLIVHHPLFTIQHFTRAFFFAPFVFYSVFPLFRKIHIFPLSLSFSGALFCFHSLVQCTRYTESMHTAPEKHQCECARSTHNEKNNKNENKQQKMFLRLSHGRQVEREIFCLKRNEERLPKSFTFDGASIGNWICIDVGGQHLHRNVQFTGWFKRRMWNSICRKNSPSNMCQGMYNANVGDKRCVIEACAYCTMPRG